MKRFTACCFRGGRSSKSRKRNQTPPKQKEHFQEPKEEVMENPQANNAGGNGIPEEVGEIPEKPQLSNADNTNSQQVREIQEETQPRETSLETSSANNIILNHDFSGGLDSWHPNSCDAFVVSGESGDLEGISANSGSKYVVNKKRKECWHGLEQDITSRVSPGLTYKVSACVRVSSSPPELAKVVATLKLEYQDSPTNYIFVGRVSVSHERWENLTGTFCLETMPSRVVLYLEGPEPGVDLLIDSVVCEARSANNIILNHDFSGGLDSWHPNSCDAFVVSGESGDLEGISANSGSKYVVTKKRKECWHGLEQDITNRVSPGLTYKVSACVRVSSSPPELAKVVATLKLEYQDSPTKYIFVGRVSVSHERWENLTGTFCLETMPSRVVLYLEGPEPGVDLLIDSVVCKASSVNNIILNHDFSGGLDSWHPNSCDAFVVSGESGDLEGISANSGSKYVVTKKRKECWHGLEQDITSRVSPGLTYKVSACVRVSSSPSELAKVVATLKLEYQDSPTNYIFVGRVSVSHERWENLTGTFCLETMPSRVVLYLEGPEPGVDLLIDSVACESDAADNIIHNHDFSGGLSSWHPNFCDGLVVTRESGYREGLSANTGSNYAVITNRKECWQGLEQDITTRVSPGSAYIVSACVRVSSFHQEPSKVIATLKLEHEDSSTSYLFIGRASASKERWQSLIGTFTLETLPKRVIFFLEGPDPGVDLLIDSVVISSSVFSKCETGIAKPFHDGDENRDESIILNPRFEDGLNNWSGRSCKILVQESMGDGKIVPSSGKYFACATERTQTWNGIQQDITGRVQRKRAYEVNVVVRIFGNNVTTADVRATLFVQIQNQHDQYIGIANLQATDKDWVQIQGKFLLNSSPSKVVVYLEGPPAGTDILVNTFQIKHAAILPPSPRPPNENVLFGVNAIQNANLNDGLNWWFALGPCTLSIGTGSPRILPEMARASLGPHEPLNGRFIRVTNRTQNWMGPAQMITDKLKIYSTYQVSAWVRLGSGITSPQNVNVALDVDGQWVNGGQTEVGDDRWHELGGSFRIEKQPSKVMVYIQGPSAGVDLMIAGLQIFPVDRRARFKHLKRQTDKIRKRDIILKFSGSPTLGTFVKVKQTQNSFPFGTCISRSNIDNEDFVDFFVKNFNWAVFGNELKWYWTEAQQGNFNYNDADELLDFCAKHNIDVRGHCIFWDVIYNVQPWVQSLNKTDLMTAVQNRLKGLLTRYNGKFRHYDVNNEMLHGSYFPDKLGKDIRSYMFKTANQLDPSATLFVNDYHVEDGCDTRSSPEKYIEQILDLQEQGAPVGGIGVQGHIDNPVGPVVCSALDKLGILGLPIWFTELDVSAANEYVRADDLEVMLREAFAHPAVEGIVLWGFWELFMSRDNAHLVDAEGSVNKAGKRYLELKKEWLSNAHGHIDDQGEFCFRGFHGSYTIEITTYSNKVVKTFVVDKGYSPLVVNIDL
ncbi:hypothetical protein MKW94_015977 [Papaver nudicaule]|uniref:GH10 domain-containing protein n=1 Tax=Papaver nudicaule TaxID=74823 RepID=A0AA41V3I2_PAPNU|nr:hypothetical protein [Papaver nudicaule]